MANISDNTHVGLLHTPHLTGTSSKCHSPGAESKKRQLNLFGTGSLNFAKETAMLNEEVLMDGDDIYINGVPKRLED